MVLSSEKNLYEILEISSVAGEATIKAAYRKLARKYHPDLNHNDAECVIKFKQVTEAYEILSDTDKKKNYDILRGFYQHDDMQAARKQADKAYRDVSREEKKSSSGNSQQNREHGYSNVFDDILKGFKSSTSSQNKTRYQNASQEFRTRQARPERGTDVNTDITITMSEAITGTSRTINILHTEKCPNCEGRKFINDSKCPLCKGSGEQSVHKKLNVKIPANVKENSKIRIANEGNKGYNGGKNGDLYLKIKIQANPSSNANFKYDGLNILYTIPITTYEAVLGASIEVPTLEGTVTMKILPKTHSGQKFRLSNQGLKSPNFVQDGKIGDIIVTVNIEIPKDFSKRELELYAELKSIAKENVRENFINGL